MEDGGEQGQAEAGVDIDLVISILAIVTHPFPLRYWRRQIIIFPLFSVNSLKNNFSEAFKPNGRNEAKTRIRL